MSAAPRQGAQAAAEAGAHATRVAAQAPGEVLAGADFAVSVTVSCPLGCDLTDARIGLTAGQGAAVDGALPAVTEGQELAPASAPADAPPPSAGATHRILLKAPARPADHVFELTCTACESGGAHHHAASVRVPVRVRPHPTSLAAFAIPSPVVAGQPLTLKVGARSSAGSSLAGTPIAVCDAHGTVLAHGRLGAAPWPGTTALYWTQLTLSAPAQAGMARCSVVFEAPDSAHGGPPLAHEGSSLGFSLAVVDPPEHVLTVKVVERGTATPVAGAQVRLGPYRGATGSCGTAQIALRGGTYALNVWKAGFDAPPTALTIDTDCAVDVALTALAQDDPDTFWRM